MRDRMLNLSRRKAIAITGGSLLFAGHASAAGTAIDESGFVTIGGIDQWIAVQGQDIRNPVILFLHGGPAEAQSPFLQEFRPWEQAFTVVNWDQRGAGKTYGKYASTTPDMTVDRMADDAIEVAEHVCKRLGKSKVILVGHSWGAILGLHVIKRMPDRFAAYVGTGFSASWELSLEGQERWARQQALAAGDQVTLKALDHTAALPVTDWQRILASNKYKMSPSDLDYLEIQTAFIGKPPRPTKGDVADWIAGGNFSGLKLIPAIVSFDARTLGLDMPVPFFVFQGRDDHVASFDPAKDYITDVRAPIKRFVPIDGGHFALFTDPDEFVGALRSYVRPLAR
jgi:pimeloyl-ACP methyl ester carboxylesterase